jgi:tetratricopeptide (TPR) repeat protein
VRAWLYALLGSYDQAQAYYEEGLALARETGNRSSIAASLILLGNAAHSLNDSVRSRAYYEESLRLQKELEDRHGIATLLEAFVNLAVKNRQWERALNLWGAAEALRAKIGAPLAPAELPRYERLIAEVRTALVDGAAFDAGRTLTMEQAIEVALKPWGN